MRKRYFREEDVLRFISDAADAEGIWEGDDETLATVFRVPEYEAYAVLGDLCDRNHLQRLESSKYIITGWKEQG